MIEFDGTDWQGNQWNGKSFIGDEAIDNKMRPVYIGTKSNNRKPYGDRGGTIRRMWSEDLCDTHEIVQVGKNAFALRPIIGDYPDFAKTPLKQDKNHD